MHTECNDTEEGWTHLDNETHSTNATKDRHNRVNDCDADVQDVNIPAMVLKNITTRISKYYTFVDCW